MKMGCAAIAVCAVALFVVIMLFKSFNSVDAGGEGVVTCFGEVADALDPGLHVVAPWCGVETLDAHTKTYAMVARSNEGAQQGDDSLGIQSADQVGLSADVGVIYHIDRAKAPDIYRRFKSTDGVEDVVRNTSRRVVRDAASPFPAQDLIGAKRVEFGTAAQNQLAPALAEFGVVLERVEVRDVRPTSQSYQDAINAKVSAQQQADAKQYALTAAQKDAEIKRVNAEADAAAQAIRNSQPPDQRLLQQQYVEALRNTQNRVIITDGKTPVLISPNG